MEKIVRKILSYNPDESLRPERDEFMANVIALSLFLLAKKPQFNFPDNCAEVVFKKMMDSNAGQYDPFNKALNYDKDIFTYGDDYCSDLPLLAHEVCHLAQDVSGTDTVEQKHMTYLYPDEFKYFMHLLDKHNHKKRILNKDEFRAVCDFYDSYYYLQKNEFEAFTFSVEFLNTIISIGEKIKKDAEKGLTTPLSPKEEQTLFEITYDSAIVPFVNKLMQFKQLRRDKKVAKNIKMLSNSFLTTFFKKHPNWQEEFLNSIMEDDVPNTLFASMIGILMVDYNDTLAHQYFNLLAKSKFDLKSQEMIFLVQKTKIQLNKAEEILLHRALKEYNSENDTQLTYDMIKSEKVRLQKENDILMGIAQVM